MDAQPMNREINVNLVFTFAKVTTRRPQYDFFVGQKYMDSWMWLVSSYLGTLERWQLLRLWLQYGRVPSFDIAWLGVGN